MDELDRVKKVPASITVCNADGVIRAMDDRAAMNHEEDGGYGLIGRRLLDRHPISTRTNSEAPLAARDKKVYTIKKKGVRKLIYQSLWSGEDEHAGFVELSTEIPREMDHLVRS